jgi:hypothetical protein
MATLTAGVYFERGAAFGEHRAERVAQDMRGSAALGGVACRTLTPASGDEPPIRRVKLLGRERRSAGSTGWAGGGERG